MSEDQLKDVIVQTETFKAFPLFKQSLILKRKNLTHLLDLLGQADRLGIGYLKQNPYLMRSDFELIKEILG
jgi:hypothetical protein